MEEEFLQKRQAEAARDKGGLLIVAAQYGAFPDDIIDVTVQLQIQVENSKLILQPEASFAWWPGWYDPAVKQQKHLQLRYLFLGEEHEVTFEDTEMILCPLQTHSLAYRRKREERERTLARRGLGLVGLVAAGICVACWRSAGQGSLWEKITQGVSARMEGVRSLGARISARMLPTPVAALPAA